MDRRKKIIIQLMKNEHYVPLKAKEIAVLLTVPKNEYGDFVLLLKELENEGKIIKTKKSKYMLSGKEYVQGTYSSTTKSYGFVTLEDEKKTEVFIEDENSLNAFTGDIVQLEIIKQAGEKKAEGKIVKIVKHEKDTVVGIFKNSKNFGFVIPDDKKINSDIFISKSKFNKAKNNQKVVAKITKYPIGNKSAEGEIIEIIGNVNEAGVDMLSVIKEYKLPYEFPKNVLDEADSINEKIELKDIPNRTDFREKEVFTIDGEDAKDLDDAVSVEKTDDGNYILYVHIADVSHYVKEKNALDKEAYIRGTSIYMFDRVIPMLPKKLSNGICSLNEGVDRFTLSVIINIDNKGNILSSEICKGIINVTKRMSYTNVQKILDGEDKKVLEEYKDYINHFKLMEELALILQEKRNVKGSLDLDLPESKIILNEDGVCIDVQKYENKFANSIIEQFMLTANEVVAEKFFWLEAPFIYRVHEVPEMDKISELNKFLFNFGYKIKGNKDNIHPKAFSEVLKEIKGKEEEKVISNLILRTLKVARYEAVNKGHFGIASKYYCHFTSPIRRYPDLFIHRIISKYLESGYNLNEKDKDKYATLAIKASEQSSEREKIAQKVERESLDIKKSEYMQDKIGNIYEGIISGVTAFGLFVELENTVEGLIRFDNLGDEFYIYDDEHKQLIGEHTKETYKMGDKITVRVIEANKVLRKVAFEKYEE